LLIKKYLTKKLYLIAGGTVLLAAALGVTATTLWGNNTSTGTDPMTVPEHTPIHVTLDQTVTSTEKPGHHFLATVSQPVAVDGRTIIPKGSHAEGVIVDSKPSGRLIGKARLQLALQNVTVDGQNYPVHTLSSREVGKGHKKRNLLWIGGGAGGGALIG